MIAGLFAVLGGCTTYQPRSLADGPDLAASAKALVVRRDTLSGAGPAVSYDVNPADGLDLVEVALLAVLNNPGLKARRAQLDVAGAQVFSAGLLPDPQISAGLDKPRGDAAGLVNGWSAGLGYDIVPLITRQARLDAQRQGQEEVRLDLLWQEWQTVQRARSMAVRLGLEEQRLALLQAMRSLYEDRYRRSGQALEEGEITLDVSGTDLTVLLDVLSQISQLELTHNETRHAFNLLLGLKPQAEVTLSALLPPPPLDSAVARRRLGSLPRLRPDLLALRAGYAAQEARVRSAVLAQFPSIGIGFNRARDTGDVATGGVSISLNLPLFSGNRGQIAVERATRKRLYEEYGLRLAQTAADVDELLQRQSLLTRQQANLSAYLPRLRILVERARKAYRHGDIDALTFLNMESTWANKRLEQIDLEQYSWENRIALETLLALPGYPGAPAALLPAAGDSGRQ